MSLAQGNNTPTRPRIEPGSPYPESDALTTRPVRSPIVDYCTTKLLIGCYATPQFFLAHLSRRPRGELIVYQSSRRPSVRQSVRASVRVFTLSNINISETNRSITTKFYLKHHWSGGLAA